MGLTGERALTNLAGAEAISVGSWQPQPHFIQRVSRAYRLAIESYEGKSIPRWFSFGPRSADIHAALIAGDDSTRAVLADPGSSYIFYGMDSLFRDHVALASASNEAQVEQARLCFEMLQRLFEVICRQPDSSDAANPESLIASLDNALAVRLDFPNPFPGESGLRTSRGIVSYRTPQAVFQAWRLLDVCKTAGGTKVLEIGAGMGRTVYYAHRFGLTDYTVVDLPATLVGASCYLAAVLGEDAIWMLGDPPKEQAGRVRLVPPTWLNGHPERFDVALNVDSFTELRREEAERYVFDLHQRVRVLLSINHENNWFRVRDIPATLGIDVPTTRSPCVMRHGYFDEVFLFSASKPKHRVGLLLRIRWLALRPLSIAREMRWQSALAKWGPLLGAGATPAGHQQHVSEDEPRRPDGTRHQLEGAPHRSRPKFAETIRAILVSLAGRRRD
jgi:putative sugar O-methyltransferase